MICEWCKRETDLYKDMKICDCCLYTMHYILYQKKHPDLKQEFKDNKPLC